MKKFIFLFISLFLSYNLLSQDLLLPNGAEFETAEDYVRYEQTIVDVVNWLMNTPVDEQTVKRRYANTFFMTWAIGNPTISIGLDEKIMTFMDERSPDLMIIFIGGWVKYTLETKDKDIIAGNIVGIESVVAFYNKNRSQLPRNKNVEKYAKLINKGKLKEQIENILRQ